MLVAAGAAATELVHQFNSPAFNGIGYSSHVLTIEQLEATRRQKLREEEASKLAKAELAAKQTNIAKFLVNVESRIYAQLSKQLADCVFGKAITSRILVAPVISITRRSKPNARPPCGGQPYFNAVSKKPNLFSASSASMPSKSNTADCIPAS